MFRTAFRFLCWEAAFAMAYETWVGSTYVNGLAGEAGVDVRMVAFLTALPWLGLAGQFAGLWAMNRIPSVKRYTLAVAALGRASWLLPLGFAAFLGWRSRATGTAFPVETWFTLLAVCASLAAVFSSSSAVAWMSWMRGLVPSSVQGRFFGARQKHVMGALILANFLAAALVGFKWQGWFVGYAALGATAIVAAAISTWLLARVPDLPAVPHHQGGRKSLWSQVLEPLRDPGFRKVLIAGAAFNGAMQFAGPYFPYYFTRDLKLPMSRIAEWSILTNLGALVASGYWGRLIDRSARPERSLLFGSLQMALSPLFYLSASAATISLVAPCEYFVNGLAWAGYALSLTALQFKRCPPGKNAAYFSMVSFANGLTGAASTLLGGYLAKWLEPWGGFRLLWVLASGLRLATLAFVVRPLVSSKNWRAAPEAVALS